SVLIAWILLVLAVIFWPPPRRRAAATYTAANCSEAAATTAVNAEIASAADGDVIQIPGCSSNNNRSSVFTAAVTPNVTLQGAGNLSVTGGGDVTTIIDDYNHAASDNCTVQLSIAAGKTLRMAGITWGTDAGSSTTSHGTYCISGPGQVRIDHVHNNL